jgi:hypothetical protein
VAAAVCLMLLGDSCGQSEVARTAQEQADLSRFTSLAVSQFPSGADSAMPQGENGVVPCDYGTEARNAVGISLKMPLADARARLLRVADAWCDAGLTVTSHLDGPPPPIVFGRNDQLALSAEVRPFIPALRT